MVVFNGQTFDVGNVVQVQTPTDVGNATILSFDSSGLYANLMFTSGAWNGQTCYVPIQQILGLVFT